MDETVKAKFLGQKIPRNDKGYFLNEAALLLAYPTGQAGWYATVGNDSNDVTMYIWDDEADDWKNTGEVAGYLKLDQTTSQTTVGRFAFPNIAVDTNTLYTDSVNHRVGIGTTNPYGKLNTVIGNSLAKGVTYSTSDFIIGTTGSMFGFKMGAPTGNTYGVINSYTTGANVYGNLILQDAGGKVGIGTTNPGQKFDITNTGASATSFGFQVVGDNGSTGGSRAGFKLVDTTSTSGAYSFISRYSGFEMNQEFGPSYSNLFRLNGSNGNLSILGSITSSGTGNNSFVGSVGIGTTEPLATLQVNTPANTAAGNGIRINRPGSTYYSGLEYTTNGTVDWSQGVNSAGFGIHEDGQATMTRLLIQDGGNVGIGTTAPTNRLDVRGTTTNDSIRSAIGFDIYQVPDPNSPTGVVSAGGSVDTGAHWYGVTYVTALGETHIKFSASQITTTAGKNTVTLTIPVSTDPRVIARRIYRTRAGHALYQDSLLATVANNTDITYVDTASDASLPSLQGAGYFRMNTTSKNITVNGTPAMALDLNGTIVGFQAGNINATGGRTTIVGKNAGANLTTATDSNLFGENAGNRLTTGNQNNLFGYNAGLYLTTGNGNTAMGHNSLLYAGTSSSNNTTIGYFAGAGVDGSSLYSNNTFIGNNAGRFTTTGSNNSSLGSFSLYNTSTGSSNVALGYYSLFSNTTGSNNSAIGLGSLSSNISGTNISALGYNAGRYIANGITARTYGNDSIYIGSNSKALTDGTNSEIVIGYNAIGKGSNTAIIGNTSLTALYVSGQIVPVKLASAPTAIEGGIYYNTADTHFYGYNGTAWKQLDN